VPRRGVAGARVEVAVGTEGERAAVDVGRAGDAGDDRLELAAERELADAVVLGGGVVDVNRLVGRYLGETAMPSRPPSPDARTSDSRWASVTVRPFASESGPTLRMRPVSRSVTRADPSGRNDMPHGTSRPLGQDGDRDLLVPPLGSSSSAEGRRPRRRQVGRGASLIGIGRPKLHAEVEPQHAASATTAARPGGNARSLDLLETRRTPG
jgi:hypothetical protein